MPLFLLRSSTNKKSKHRLRTLFLLLLLAVVGAISFVLHPDSGRTVARAAEWWSNRNADIDVSLGRIEGSLYGGVLIDRVEVRSRNPGLKLELSMPRVDVNFGCRIQSWKPWEWLTTSLYVDRPKGFVQQGSDVLADRSQLWLLELDRIEVSRGNLLIRRGETSVEFEGLSFRSPSSGVGRLWLRGAEWSLPGYRIAVPAGFAWIERSPDRLGITNLSLGPGVELSEFRLGFPVPDPRELSLANSVPNDRELTLSVAISGFGGLIRLQAYAHEEAGGAQGAYGAQVSQVSLERLSEFLKIRPAREGIIEEARLSFQGLLADPIGSNASFTLRVRDFVWQDRRWESLTAGAVYYNRHVELTDCRLEQKQNNLRLKGTVDLGGGAGLFGVAPNKFDLDVRAQLNDLSDFTRLLLPAPPECSGRLSVNGKLSGSEDQITGELAVAGSDIVIRGAPIQELSTKLMFRGQEVEVAEFKAKNGEDFITGSASMRLTEDRKYSGTLEGSLKDAGIYATALWSKGPLAEMKGTMQIKWSGDGTHTAHSGVFSAAFHKARFFTAGESEAEGVFQGSYSPGNLAVNKLEIRDKETEITAALSASQDAVQLRSIRVVHLGDTWLEGTLQLPLDYAAIQRGAPLWEIIRPDGQSNVQLTSSDLHLDTLARLLRIPVSLGGKLSFSLTGSGTTEDLSLKLDGGIKEFVVGDPKTAPPPATVTLSAGYGSGAAQMKGKFETPGGAPVEWTAVAPIELTENALKQGQVFRSNRPLFASIDFPSLPVAWLDLLYPGLKVRGGQLSGRLSVSGTAEIPGFFGDVDVSDLFVGGLSDLPTLWNIDGKLRFFQDEIALEGFTARSLRGNLNGSGVIGFRNGATTRRPLKISLRDWTAWSGSWGEILGNADLEWDWLPYGLRRLTGRLDATKITLGTGPNFTAAGENVEEARLLNLSNQLGETSLDLLVTTELAPTSPFQTKNLRIFGQSGNAAIFGELIPNRAHLTLDGRSAMMTEGSVEFFGPINQVLLRGSGSLDRGGEFTRDLALYSIGFEGALPRAAGPSDRFELATPISLWSPGSALRHE